MTMPLLWYLESRQADSSDTCRVPLQQLPLRAGRRWDLALVLPFPLISWEHAEFLEDGGRLWVRDLGSKNGTFVNGRRIEWATEIVEGDVVHLAVLELRVGRTPSLSDLHGATIELPLSVPQSFVEQAQRFSCLMRERAVDVLFQPIFGLRGAPRLAYELLGRGRHGSLPASPAELLEIASRLGAAADLSQLFRSRGLEEARLHLPPGTGLFLNTHPAELQRPAQLVRGLEQIRAAAPGLELTLEIHEKAVSHPGAMRNLYAQLRDLGVQIAYDDFGAGASRLAELAEAPPDVIKFDTTMIQGIDSAPAARRAVVSSMLKLAADLGIVTVAEGIETKACLEACRALGFDAGQGYFCGMPAPAESFALAVPA
ncbi:MAG: EAL domain-containing protein [Thermoanaerobaculia bacterium]